MRVLVPVNDAYGHVLPLIPAIQEMTDRGHEVTLAIPGHSTPRLELHGVRLVRYPNPAPPPPVEAPPRRRFAERLDWAIHTSWPNDARGWTAALLADARAEAPDVLICEPVEHAGRVVAAALGVPQIEHGWGFSLPAGADDKAAAGLADLYASVGATPREPDLRVDLGPAAVQSADSDHDVFRFRYTPWSSPAPQLPPPPAGLRRVLVTLGTMPHDRAAERLHSIVTALDRPGVEPVVVLGRDDRVPEQPWADAVVTTPWADMPAEIAQSSLVVHHGGAGTSWATLCAGRPAVCFPQAGDQFRNASLIAGAGAAITLGPGVDDHAALADAFTAALGDGDLAEAAVAIRRANEALPGPSALADHIEAVVHGR